jgi:hypothetical protein
MESDSLYHNLVPIKFAPTFIHGFFEGKELELQNYLTHIICHINMRHPFGSRRELLRGHMSIVQMA